MSREDFKRQLLTRGRTNIQHQDRKGHLHVKDFFLTDGQHIYVRFPADKEAYYICNINQDDIIDKYILGI